MFSRSISYIDRFGPQSLKILKFVQPRPRLGSSAEFAAEHAGSSGRRWVGQLPVTSLPTARKFCTGATKEVDRKVKGGEVSDENNDESILDGFNLRAKRPSKLDRWILVFMGRYKSDEDIPDFVSNTIINSTKNKFRIIVNIGMGVFALVGGIVMIYIGRKRMQAGESIAGMNMEKRKEFYERTKSSSKE